MILQDSPIQYQSQDELGRSSLVELIANSIIEFSKKTHPCTNIGIYGAWGCGKTSMMNLVQNYLVENGNRDNIAIVRFNPWEATSSDLLMKEFFKCICADFEETLRDSIKKYGDILALAARAVPYVGQPLSEGIIGVKEALSSSESSLREQKEKISKSIKKSKKHLLVFIDDLDRLDKEELHAVFRLIRQMADFDNTMYVVAMDVEMASKSIAQFYGGSSVEDGRRFIDKIIQVPIVIPVIQKPFLTNYMVGLLRGIIKPYTKPFMQAEENDILEIAKKASNLFETKRDCIRFINQLRFVFPSVAKEVNVHDFCLLEAIKVISQEAYLDILYNKDALLKNQDKVKSSLMDSKDMNELLDRRFREAVGEITKDLSVHNLGDKIKDLLANDLFAHNSTDVFQLIDQQRLQHPIYFDKYFVMAVPEHLIPDSEMDVLKSKILSMGYESIAKWIEEKCERYSSEEIQRATLRVIRKFDQEEKRCKATKLVCEALSVTQLAKGYEPNLYNRKRTDVFVTATLIPWYMVKSQQIDDGLTYVVDVVCLDETLKNIYKEGDFNYCMQIQHGVSKLPQIVTNSVTSSFEVLKKKFVSLPFDEQMKFHKELLISFYSYWKRTDSDGMTSFLTKLLCQNDSYAEILINKFIQNNGSSTKIDTFVEIFEHITPLIVTKLDAIGKDYGMDTPVRLFLANYKEVLKTIR